MLKIIAPQTGIVYGPIESRRFGRSLGINWLPAGRKLCNFHCRYCQYGGHGYPDFIEFPSLARLEEEIGFTLARLASRQAEIDWITISGNGEPTLYPQFDRAVDMLLRLRDQHYPGTPVGILTNGTSCLRPTVRMALERLDGRFVKLDAGNETVFKDVNEPCAAVTWDKWLEGVRRLEHITIQSCFFEGPHSNTEDRAIQAWSQILKLLSPDAVQIYTLDRMPFDSSLWPTDRDTLLEIARLARESAGVPVSVCLPDAADEARPASSHQQR